ncbi:MAG: hypothetical protein ABI999_04940 [Acidobacteriota bacterium]
MDPLTAIIGAIVVVALFLLVVAALRYVAGSWTTVSKEEISAFGVQPNFICPSPSCAVDIDYTVDTTHDNTTVSLKVTGPKGTTRELSTARTLSLAKNGADAAFWMDGPGDYLFTLHVTGDQIGDRSELRKATLFTQAGGPIKHSAHVDMGQAVDLQVARDAFGLTEHPQLKIPEYTICEKSAKIVGVRYLSASAPGHQTSLDITIRKRDTAGTPLWDLTGAVPGDAVLVDPPIVIAGGVEVDGTMASGFSGHPPNTVPNPFSASDTVHWEIEIDVVCI